jgi:hypothetical protein
MVGNPCWSSNSLCAQTQTYCDVSLQESSNTENTKKPSWIAKVGKKPHDSDNLLSQKSSKSQKRK